MPEGHFCPGGCGAKVPRSLFACKDCWYRLPQELRRRITYAYHKRQYDEHIRAMAEAASFYASEESTP